MHDQHHDMQLYSATRVETYRDAAWGEKVWIALCSCGARLIFPIECDPHYQIAKHRREWDEFEKRQEEVWRAQELAEDKYKVSCPECGKRVKPNGLTLHIRYSHALRVHGCAICDEIESICRPGVEFTSESEFAILQIGKRLSPAATSRVSTLQVVRMHLYVDGRRDVAAVLKGLMKSPERRGEFRPIGEPDA